MQGSEVWHQTKSKSLTNGTDALRDCLNDWRCQEGLVNEETKEIAQDGTENNKATLLGWADHLYREIRVENELTDENGEKVTLKPGAEVDLVLEADSDATIRRPS